MIDNTSRYEHAFSNVFINDEERIRYIYDNSKWRNFTEDWLRYVEYKPNDEESDSLEKLVEWFLNKRSKRVRYAGKRLRKAFPHLPPVEQKKVGLTLLTGSRLDIEWVCRHLDNWKESYEKEWIVKWHPCYANAIAKCWEKYHSKHCGRIAVLFLDEQYIREHIDEFKNQDLYFRLCKRFVNEPWFVVDIDLLKKSTSISAYLFIMSQTPHGIPANEARQLLYQWVITVALCDGTHLYQDFKDYSFWNYKAQMHSVIYAPGLSAALYYVLKMGFHDIVKEFLKWDLVVCETFALYLYPETKDDRENYGLFRTTILECIPEGLKYLARVNRTSCDYISTISQPFTEPRYKGYGDASKYLEIIETNESHLLGAEENVEMSNKTKIENIDAFNSLLSVNPKFQDFIDKLGLIPTEVQNTKEEKRQSSTLI